MFLSRVIEALPVLAFVYFLLALANFAYRKAVLRDKRRADARRGKSAGEESRFLS